MGAVGINFGSATSGTGFDVTSTVASIVTNLQAVETPWKTQLASLTADDTAFTSIGTDLATLGTSLRALTDFQGVLASKQGSSSDTDVVALSSASATATAGSHTIVVSQLAQTSSVYSDAIASTDTLSGSLTIQVGSGTAQTVTVGSSSNTLASYAAAVNAADIGVSASVVSDTSGSRLSLVSATSGSAGQLTLSGSLTDASTSSTLPIHAGLTGQDANLTVDGVAVVSGSNTVSTAIPGVTFTVLAASPGTPVSIQIANDNATVETAFSTLVSSYNAVVKDIKSQEGLTSTGAAEPLYGNTVLAQIQTALSQALTSGTASGNIANIDQLGLSVNDDGTLTLDSSTLDAALNSSFQDVVGFLQNGGSFGQNLSSTLDQLSSTNTTGAIYLALATDTTEETGLNDNVTSQEAIIATQKTQITAELNQANEALQAIPSQLNEIDELYNALTGYTPSNK